MPAKAKIAEVLHAGEVQWPGTNATNARWLRLGRLAQGLRGEGRGG